MAHISAIGASMFSDLSFAIPLTDFTGAQLGALDTDAEFKACFGAELQTGANLTSRVGTSAAPVGMTFVRIKNARSFPAMGTPANIVKVPTYGSKTSSSIQGQSDAPQLEIDLNFVASDWAKSSGTATVVNLGDYVGNGIQYIFRFTLLNTAPANYLSTDTTGMATTVGGSAVQNSQYFWYGKMEALLVTPSLTDAATAKLTLSIQSPFYGAYTSN